MTPEIYKKFLIAQLYEDGLSVATIEFFLSILDDLKKYFRLSAAEMGRLASITRETARRHAQFLEDAGYLSRAGYRGWRLKEPILRDPDLVSVVNKLTA